MPPYFQYRVNRRASCCLEGKHWDDEMVSFFFPKTPSVYGSHLAGRSADIRQVSTKSTRTYISEERKQRDPIKMPCSKYLPEFKAFGGGV